MWRIYPHRVQHIDRNWYYLAEIEDSLKQKMSIREAQMMMAKSEKAPAVAPSKYEPFINYGKKHKVLPDYWNWGG